MSARPIACGDVPMQAPPALPPMLPCGAAPVFLRDPDNATYMIGCPSCGDAYAANADGSLKRGVRR